MKKVLLLAILAMVGFSSYAQTKVEQYCEVVATAKFMSRKVTIDIDYGEFKSMWKDNRIKDDEGKAKAFNSVIDAINYLGKAGWKLVNAFPVTEGNSGSVYHYVFKKEFDLSETVGTGN